MDETKIPIVICVVFNALFLTVVDGTKIPYGIS